MPLCRGRFVRLGKADCRKIRSQANGNQLPSRQQLIQILLCTCRRGRHLHYGSAVVHSSWNRSPDMERETAMEAKREMLVHFLAAIAYRTRKALRNAPESFADYRAKKGVRTPHELLHHMTSVLGYARTFFVGGEWRPARLPAFTEEVSRFHEILESLRDLIRSSASLKEISCEQLASGAVLRYDDPCRAIGPPPPILRRPRSSREFHLRRYQLR